MKVFKCQEELDNIEVQFQTRVNSLLTHPFQHVMIFSESIQISRKIRQLMYSVVSIKRYDKYKFKSNDGSCTTEQIRFQPSNICNSITRDLLVLTIFLKVFNCHEELDNNDVQCQSRDMLINTNPNLVMVLVRQNRSVFSHQIFVLPERRRGGGGEEMMKLKDVFHGE